MTKRVLVLLSHAIEQAALAAADDGPMLVMAMFQRGSYFARESAMYGRLAERAEAAVVGGVGVRPTGDGPGPEVVDLAEADPLAREWSVAVLTPRFGAVLVAHDLEQVAAAATLEAGRLFDGRWSFRRDEALHEVARLRQALGERLSAATRATIDAILDRARELPSAAGEARSEASIRLLADRLGRAAAPAPGPGPDGDVGDEKVLSAWSGADGTTASGTLPVALVGLRLVKPQGLPPQAARLTETMAAIEILRAVTAVLRPVDRATRMGGDDLLLSLPAVSHQDAVELAGRLRADIAALRARHPFIPDTYCVVLVTRERPLPLQHVADGLDWAQGQQVAVATLGDSEDGRHHQRSS